MNGLKNEVLAIAQQAKSDGDKAKQQIEKVYGSVLGDVVDHNSKIKASFGRQTSALSGNFWQVVGGVMLALGVVLVAFAAGNLGGREHGSITTVK